MALHPFTMTHAATVASWPRSAEEAAMWCGTGEFPVSVERVAGWQQEDDVQAYLLIMDDILVGYGELWLDAEENEVELARIIIAPAERGEGLGRLLVHELLSEAEKASYPEIFMRVHPDNSVALRCYQRVGFVQVEAALAKEWNAVQPVEYRWLRLGSAP